MNAEFCFNFLDLPTDSKPNPERYRDFFLNYEFSRWSKGSGGGSFIYIKEDGERYSIVLESTPIGISIKYGAKSKDGRGEEWFSVGDDSTINQFKTVGDEIIIPAGSILEPDKAWLAVEDFIANPTLRSDRIQWVDSNKLNWPEM